MPNPQTIPFGSKPLTPVASSATPKVIPFGSKPIVATPPVTSDTTTPQQPNKPGFLKSLISAPATLIARPIQVVAEGVFGASPEAIDKFSTEHLGGIVAPVPRNFSDVKKDIGRGIETVGLGLGPIASGAAIGAGNSLEEGSDLLSAQTAFQIVLGAGIGKVADLVGKPLMDAAGKVIGRITPRTLKEVSAKGANAIQEFAANHSILPENAANTVNKGADVVNKVAEKPFDLAGNALSKTGTGVKNLIKNQYPNSTIQEDAFTNAKNKIATQYQKVLPLTPLQQSKEANLLEKTGDNVYTTLAKHGINLGSDEAPHQLQEISNQFQGATQHAQANENGHFNVDTIKNDAFKAIDENLSSETARETAKAKVGNEIDALLKANPESVISGSNGDRLVKSDLVERLRRTGNSWTPFNASDPEKIGKSAGFSLSNAVRDEVDKHGTFPAYREANKEWGKIIHAQEVLSKIDNAGKYFKVPGGLSGSISRKILSGAFGYHTAGIGGAVLAELGSEYGTKILSNPEWRTYFDRQIIKKFNGKTPTPEAVTKLEQQIKEYIDKQSNLKQLPAPSSIRMGAKASSESTVQSVTAKKNPLTMNPKTGKFQTTYSSEPQKKVEIAPITTQTIKTPKSSIPNTLPQIKPKGKLPTKPKKL